MKKLLALLLSAVLLLSACAFAEDAAPVTHSHKLSNVYIIAGDQAIDLSDLSLELDVSGTEKPDAARLHLNTPDGSVAEVGITMADNIYYVHLASESLGHVDYAIDPVVLLARYMDQGVNGIVAMLQSLDTTGMAQGLLDAVGLIDVDAGAVEAPAATEEPEAAGNEIVIDLSRIRIEGDPMAVLMGCVSEPETAEMGGVEYAPDGSEIVIADGTYTTQEFTIDTETLCTVLNMLYLDGEPSGLGDMVRETGVSFEVHGTFQTGEDEGLNRIASVTATLDDGTTQQTMTLDLNTFYGSDGKTTAVIYGQTTADQSVGLSFYLTKGQHEGEAFTSGSIDVENAISLTDMETAELLDTLGGALATVGGEALGVISNALVESMMAGVDMSALQTELEEAAAAE